VNRDPILTIKEQRLLAFVLALIVIGGIVQEIRLSYKTSTTVSGLRP
jgi:hypothetical protein